MKRLLFSVLMYLTALLCLAQDYEPTSSWPYIYGEFTDGMLMQPDGKERPGKYNIHILEGRLHFIDGDMVCEANPDDIRFVRIGNDVYANVTGTMMKIMAESGNGMVTMETLVDMAGLNATGGAYGSSSNSVATTALSSLEGIGGTRSNMNHMELRNSKDSGKTLPVVTKFYLVYGSNAVYATKRDVLAVDGVSKDGLTKFCKENRIKWKDPESLIKVLDFITNGQKKNL